MSRSRRTNPSRVFDREIKVHVVWSTRATVSGSGEAELIADMGQQMPFRDPSRKGKLSIASFPGCDAPPAPKISPTVAGANVSTQRTRTSPPPTEESRTFPEIVHAMVTETARDDPSIIDWVNDGEAFVVKQLASSKLSNVLHRYFRHGKYSSLQRQLNMYGWSKCLKGKHKGAFFNKNFHRDCPNTAVLATLIQRRDNLRKSPKSRRQSTKKTSTAKKRHKPRTPVDSMEPVASAPPAKKVTPFPDVATTCPATRSAKPVMFMSDNSDLARSAFSSFHKGKLVPKFSPATISRPALSPPSHHLPAKKRPLVSGIDPFEGIQLPGLDETTPAQQRYCSSSFAQQPSMHDQQLPKHAVQWSPLLLEDVATPGATPMPSSHSLSVSPKTKNSDSNRHKLSKVVAEHSIGVNLGCDEQSFDRRDAASALALMAASPPPTKPFLFSPTLHRFPPAREVEHSRQQIETAAPPTSLTRAGSSSYAPLPLLRNGSSSDYLMPYAGMVADALGTGQGQ